MDNSYQNSTISQILEAIINESSFDGSSSSEIGDILLSILNNTSYDKEPESVIGKLLIKLKAKIAGESFEPYDGTHISRIADILLATLNAEEYNEAPQSKIAELLLELKAKIEDNPEGTASGKIASFMTTLEEGAIKSVEIDIKTSADGYDDMNIYVTGINLFDGITELGAIDDQTGASISANDCLRSKRYIPIMSGENYYLKIGADKNISIYWYNDFFDFISVTKDIKNTIVTPPEGAEYFRLGLSVDYGTIYNNDISLNYPSDNTEVNPALGFNGTTIYFDGVGTVYGGKVFIEEDGAAYYQAEGETEKTKLEYDPDPIITFNGANNMFSLRADNINVTYLKR